MNNSERVFLPHLNSQGGFVRWVSFWASFWLAKLQHQHFNGRIIKITYRYSAPLKGATFFEALLWEDIIRDYKTPGFSNIKKWSCCNMCMYGMDFMISTWGSFLHFECNKGSIPLKPLNSLHFSDILCSNQHQHDHRQRPLWEISNLHVLWVIQLQQKMKVKMPRQLVQWLL